MDVNKLDKPVSDHGSIVHALRNRSIGTRRSNSVHDDLHSYAESLAATLATTNKKVELPPRTRSTFIVAFSPDNDLVASCHGDHNIHITEVATGRLVQTLSGHMRSPWCVQFHPNNNQILASGCLNGEVRVWDLIGGGSESWTPSDEENTTVSSLSFHPNDHVVMVAAGSEIHFWDWSLPKPFASVKTSSGEKVRLARFSLLGDYILTGVANLTDDASGEEEGHPPNQEPPTADWGPPTLLDFVDPPERSSLHSWLNSGRNRTTSGSSRTTGSWGRTGARRTRPATSSRLNIRTRMNRRDRRGGSDAAFSINQADANSPQSDTNMQSDDLTDSLNDPGVSLEQYSSNPASQRNNPQLDSVLLSQSALSQPPLRLAALSQPLLRLTPLPQPPLRLASPSPRQLSMAAPRQPPSPLPPQEEASPRQPTPLQQREDEPPTNRDRLRRLQRLVDLRSRAAPGGHLYSRDHERILHASVSVNAEIQHQYNRLQLLRQERRRLELRLQQLQHNETPPALPDPSELFPELDGSGSSMEDDLTSILASRIQDRILNSLSGPGVEMSATMATVPPSEPPLEVAANPAFHEPTPAPPAPGFLDFPQREIRLRRLRRPTTRARASHLRSHINHILSLYPDPHRVMLDRTGYKLQWWDFSKLTLPEISRPEINVIVPSCKIYNDSSLDISRDGTRLACFVPADSTFNSTMVQVSVFSLEPCSLGTLLYRRVVGSSAVCLSLSPLGNYLAVGLKRRDYLRDNSRPPMAQVLKLNKRGEFPTSVVHYVTHPVLPDTPQRYVNINTIAWLPGVGHGLVYGTNNGELRICST